MEIYACHEKAISSLILESPPVQMTIADWVHAQKADPTINQVIIWMEKKEAGKQGKWMKRCHMNLSNI